MSASGPPATPRVTGYHQKQEEVSDQNGAGVCCGTCVVHGYVADRICTQYCTQRGEHCVQHCVQEHRHVLGHNCAR